MSEIRNAVIKSTSLTIGDHGCLSAWLHLDFGGSGQGFGGYSLGSSIPGLVERDSRNWAGIHIVSILSVVGVPDWSMLPGKTIRADIGKGRINGIGHIVKDKWFYPEEVTARLA